MVRWLKSYDLPISAMALQHYAGQWIRAGDAWDLVSCRTPTPWAIARSLPLPVRSISVIAANRCSIIRFGHKIRRTT